jgi:hypothetical protein
MRINVSINHVKMLAKRLKRSLAARGIEMKLSVCQNLVARLYGYAHYHEMHRTQVACLSVRDLEIDADTAAACRQYQKGVLTQAGFGDVADALLDEIAPIGTFVMKALKDA